MGGKFTTFRCSVECLLGLLLEEWDAFPFWIQNFRRLNVLKSYVSVYFNENLETISIYSVYMVDVVLKQNIVLDSECKGVSDGANRFCLAVPVSVPPIKDNVK